MTYQKHLRVAIEAAQKAGTYLLSQQNSVTVKDVSLTDFVTEQDQTSERMIMETIRHSFPGAQFIAEEDSKQHALSRPTSGVWIVDPLDGTIRFGNGSPFFAVSIAYWENGETKVGVVYGPRLNEFYHAVRGQGAFLNDKPLEMRLPQQPNEQAIIATAFYRYKKHPMPHQLFKSVLETFTDIQRAGSAALDISHVASGVYGAYFEDGVKPWDVAAGMLILEEMDGYCSDFQGKPLDIFRMDNGMYRLQVIFSKSKGIHERLVGLTREQQYG